MVKRRYQSSTVPLKRDENDLLPDVLLIDGGMGHLNTAAQVFKLLGIKPPCLAALAKGKLHLKKKQTGLDTDLSRSERDTLYITCPAPGGVGRSSPIRGDMNSSGFKLLQYVRDEAHRFAQKYHHLLRKKRMYL